MKNITYIMHPNKEQIDPSIFDDVHLTIKQVCDELAISRSHVYALMQRGELGYTPVGTKKGRRIPRVALKRFLMDRYRPGQSD